MKTIRLVCPHCGKKYRSNNELPHCGSEKCKELESRKYDLPEDDDGLYTSNDRESV
jgi:endogenous inhibitor of DNA gyrase (YacG/DUF329 family)